MNATLLSRCTTVFNHFRVVHGGLTYDVTILTDERGKFMEENITFLGEELEGEGTQGEIRDAITDYLAENWDTLVKTA